MDDASNALAPASKPFLKRNSGWETRVAAVREGRRYVPRGGPVKDYSKEEEAPLPKRRQPPSRIPKSPSKSAGRAVASGNGGARRPAGGLPAMAARGTAPLDHHQRQQPPGPAGRPAPSRQPANTAAVGAPTAAASSNEWARKLLQGSGGHTQPAPLSQQQQQHTWEARQAQEDFALEEFEALESQVLREVGNCSPAQPLGPSAGSAGKKAGSSSRSPLRREGRSGAQAAAAAAFVSNSPGGACEHGAAGWQEQADYADDEDMFQSDGEGNARHCFGEDSQAQAAAAGISHPMARCSVNFGAPAAQLAPAQRGMPAVRPRHPPVYCEDEEYQEAQMLEAESSFVRDLPPQPTSNLVQKYFSRPPPPAAAGSAAGGQLPSQLHGSGAEAEAVEQLQQEVVRLQEERARVARLRLELEEAAARLDQEKAALEKRKLEAAAAFDAERAEELRKLQRDRRVLEKQSRAILKMPTKQSKEEVQAVEALLAEERRIGRAREARHKLTVERLRQQMAELQDKNAELREQVQYMEQQRLQESWGAAAEAPAAPGGPTAAGVSGSRSTTTVSAAAAAAASHASAASGCAQLPGSRQRQYGGLPVVKVERGSSAAGGAQQSSCGRPRQQQLLGKQQQQQQLQPSDWAEQEDEEYAEQLISDVQLSEEVVVWQEEEEAQQQLQEHYAGGLLSSSHIEDDYGGSSAAAWRAAGSAGPSQPTASGAVQSQLGRQQAARPGAELPPASAAAMGTAPSALARFNQLRDSLVQHEGLQQAVGSRLASLQPSAQPLAPPPAASTAGFAANVGSSPPAAGAIAEDDLRRLGRSMLIAAAPQQAASSTAEMYHQQQAQQQSLPLQQAMLQAPAQPAAAGAGDAVVSELQHTDGRWERLFTSGLREQTFLNGSTKQQMPGGASLTRFANGDVKKALPCGSVEYYYAEVSSWQVTHPSGVDVYFFPSGQVEAHHPGGIKEILFADGAVRKVLPDGRELAISAAHLTREIQLPQPALELR